MIPQHSAAPFRQQRWLELENTGSVAIPSWGVCEISDSYRPEKTGGKTPNGGRTVLKVERATEDSPNASVVNGPCEIPISGTGRVGTMDSPMIALVDSDYAVGTEIGVAQDSFVLASGYTGYIMLGDYDSATGTARVARITASGHKKRYGFTGAGGIAAATLSSSQITPGSASVTEWRWNGTVYAAGDAVTVYNPFPDAIVGDRLISFSLDQDGLLTIDAEACNAFEEASP